MPSPFNDRRTRAQCGRAAERQRTVTLPGDSAAWNGTARRSVPRAVLATVSLLKYLSGEVAGVFAAEAALSFFARRRAASMPWPSRCSWRWPGCGMTELRYDAFLGW